MRDQAASQTLFGCRSEIRTPMNSFRESRPTIERIGNIADVGHFIAYSSCLSVCALWRMSQPATTHIKHYARGGNFYDLCSYHRDGQAETPHFVFQLSKIKHRRVTETLNFGSGGGDRTPDILVNSQALLPLSYSGTLLLNLKNPAFWAGCVELGLHPGLTYEYPHCAAVDSRRMLDA